MKRAAHIAMQALKAGLKAQDAVPGHARAPSASTRPSSATASWRPSSRSGGTVLANACGPCIGQWKRSDVGKDETQHHRLLVQPQLPGAERRQRGDAVLPDQPGDRDRARLRGHARVRPGARDHDRAGRQGVPLHAARVARSCPRRASRRGEEGYEAPAADGDAVAGRRSPPNSERLQLLQPFPRWDGKDFAELPILVKTKGKTTTDHISPAGAWLRVRGHLDKISDNMFLGALNAFTGRGGQGRQPADRRERRDLHRRSPATSRPGAWAGSWSATRTTARGRAASTRPCRPRYLGVQGGASCRSFARIHETNLKKQGILPLTFAEPHGLRPASSRRTA